jgi:uncharacterized protein with HEPN domain
MKPDDRIRIMHDRCCRGSFAFLLILAERIFLKNRMLILSVIKEIEILGEAAKIPEITKRKYAEIPGRSCRHT